MKILSYYLVFSGLLGVITVLMTVLQGPAVFSLIYLFYIIYMSLISISIIYFALNLEGEKSKISHLGCLIVIGLSMIVFSFQELHYAVVLGIGVIFSIAHVNNWVFNISFPVSEFTIQYTVNGSDFSIGVNLISLFIFIFLLKNYHRIGRGFIKTT